MAKKDKIEDQWKIVKKQAIDKCFKLGSVFFWHLEGHYFLYLGPLDSTKSFFVMASSQPYRSVDRNFTIVPEDFREAKQGTKSRSFTKNTHFLLSEYLQYTYETLKLHEYYISGNLDYKFNLKADLPEAYDRLLTFINKNLPPAYAKKILDLSNILPDKKC
ncbi:MAG TPA: hypothetical protein DCO75_08945 [Fibrobacteres bacterium]|jgi:hypothetical protein|nr:hypothetical protein [Fibrobacterota bacterium]